MFLGSAISVVPTMMSMTVRHHADCIGDGDSHVMLCNGVIRNKTITTMLISLVAISLLSTSVKLGRQPQLIPDWIFRSSCDAICVFDSQTGQGRGPQSKVSAPT